MVEANRDDFDRFVAGYPGAAVKLGKFTMTIEQAVAFRHDPDMCPAAQRGDIDPAEDLHYLAHGLQAAGSLRPEHQPLLAQPGQ